MKKKQYREAADAATRLIELIEQNPRFAGPWREQQFTELYGQRAVALALNKDYDAALGDLRWIETHAALSTGYEVQTMIGFIEILQGKEGEALKIPAAKGNPLALLLLQAPENKEPPKTEWLLLSPEDQIRKYVERGHYAQAIEALEKYDLVSTYGSYRSDPDWLALRGVCYALRGNWVQAAKDLTEAHERSFRGYPNELALIYAMAGHRDRAIKILDKRTYFHHPLTELIRQRIDQIAPPPTVPALPQERIDAAKEKLLQFLKALNPNITPEQLQFRGAIHHVWPNSALGRPEPGQNYLQVITPGFILQFQYGNGKIDVHTNERGTYFILPGKIELQ
jgi:hypothetical protein